MQGCGDGASKEFDRVLIVGTDSLSVALAAALGLLGWPSVAVVDDESAVTKVAPPDCMDHRPRVVVVADHHGRFPIYWPSTLAARAERIVVVGGLAAGESMALAVNRGAVAALNADQPFRALMEELHTALSDRRTPGSRESARTVSGLRDRTRESSLFASLTDRECEILGAIALGASATDMAAAKHISLATVRSHLQRILAKLGVGSQVAAIAMVHRSCLDPRLLCWIRAYQQF